MFNWRERALRALARRFHIGEDVLRHLSTFQRLGERLEVRAPTEMIPIGARTMARALRTRAVPQIRPGWLWPYWLERQLNPNDVSFTPRGHLPFLTNLTHRNWTAVGNPDSAWEAVVDPAGLVSTIADSWSVDWWIECAGTWVLPSRSDQVRQRITAGGTRVSTTVPLPGGGEATAEVYALRAGSAEYAAIEVGSDRPVTLVFAIRPYNVEGLSVVQEIRVGPDTGRGHDRSGSLRGASRADPERSQAGIVGHTVAVDGCAAVVLPEPPDCLATSTFREGDCLDAFLRGATVPFRPTVVQDEAGLAQLAIGYSLPAGQRRRLLLPLPPVAVRHKATKVVEPAPSADEAAGAWRSVLGRGMRTRLPDRRLQEAVDANRAYLLVLHDPGSITAGPLTYHRFWFRDAAYQVSALDRWGFHEQAADVLNSYPSRQQHDGFFYSQWHEWDANGSAIFAIAEHHRLAPDADWLAAMMPAVRRGADWIERKRHRRAGNPHPGLMPAGVSAEHLGPYDVYYWDNFWSVRGLRDAAYLAEVSGRNDDARRWRAAAEDYAETIRASIAGRADPLEGPYIPAGPSRGIDAGMIGSLVACYPLELLEATDPLITGTVARIRERFMFGPAFFQEIAHTGLGTYLTMQLAYVELLAGDPLAWSRLRWLLDLASPTYTWPEAIHPRTGGGCMGDGHHGWATADFLGFVRAVLVRDIPGDTVAVLSLLPADWYGQPVQVDDAPVAGGRRLSYRLDWRDDRPVLSWSWVGESARLTAPALDPHWSSRERSGERTFEPASKAFAAHAGDRPRTPTAPG